MSSAPSRRPMLLGFVAAAAALAAVSAVYGAAARTGVARAERDELTQRLRLAMLVVERSVRGAGAVALADGADGPDGLELLHAEQPLAAGIRPDDLVGLAGCTTRFAAAGPTATPTPRCRLAQPVTYRVAADQLEVRVGATGGAWTPVAAAVEDLQVALVLDDGRVCGGRDAPPACPLEHVWAVRVTLVGHTLGPRRDVAGSDGNDNSDGPVWFENRARRLPADGHERRWLTSLVRLRNRAR